MTMIDKISVVAGCFVLYGCGGIEDLMQMGFFGLLGICMIGYGIRNWRIGDEYE